MGKSLKDDFYIQEEKRRYSTGYRSDLTKRLIEEGLAKSGDKRLAQVNAASSMKMLTYRQLMLRGLKRLFWR